MKNHEERVLEQGVFDFSRLMRKRLFEKLEEGFSEWNCSSYTESMIVDKLKQSLNNRDYVDVANFAMLAHMRTDGAHIIVYHNKVGDYDIFRYHCPLCGMRYSGDYVKRDILRFQCKCGQHLIVDQHVDEYQANKNGQEEK
jgi:hypothetical protein